MHFPQAGKQETGSDTSVKQLTLHTTVFAWLIQMGSHTASHLENMIKNESV